MKKFKINVQRSICILYALFYIVLCFPFQYLQRERKTGQSE